jgi:apolipoprotein N-acyltransferase
MGNEMTLIGNEHLSDASIERGVPLPMLVMLSVLSGALLSIPFLSSDHYWLTWLGFIPLLIAIEGASLFRSYCLGVIAGLVFSISAGYWMIDFLMLSKGYGLILSSLFSLIFWLYSAQLFGMITLVFNWVKQHINVYECILFPVTVASFYAITPMIFTPHLGESQSQFLVAIQAIEFVGVHGLNFIIALTNVLLFRLVFRIFLLHELKSKQTKSNPEKCSYAVATLLLISWFYYGWSSSLIWESKIKKWDTVSVGLIQPNEAPSLKKQILYPGFSRAFPPEMAMTERLASAGAKIIIWPEAKYKAYFDQPQVAKAYRNQVNTLNTHLIFQDIEHTGGALNSPIKQQYNAALMLSETGQEVGKYQKMKRIPFGEYVPFASNFLILKRWTEEFFGPFLNEMAKGQSHQVFKTDTLNIVPLICYETMFTEFVASAVSAAVANSQTADLLVGLSSDGWFGSTHQPYQHINASILRAVENRLPLVHVLNNGPSIVAMPNGKVIFKTEAHQAGGYMVDVPHGNNSQGSFYSRHPLLFIYSVYGLMLLFCLCTFLRARQQD